MIRYVLALQIFTNGSDLIPHGGQQCVLKNRKIRNGRVVWTLRHALFNLFIEAGRIHLGYLLSVYALDFKGVDNLWIYFSLSEPALKMLGGPFFDP